MIDEQSLRITGDKPRTEDGTPEAYQPGETAVLSIQSPFAGVAWVSIEAVNLVESFVVQVNGSSGRIEVPIKPEYAPNVWASVVVR